MMQSAAVRLRAGVASRASRTGSGLAAVRISATRRCFSVTALRRQDTAAAKTGADLEPQSTQTPPATSGEVPAPSTTQQAPNRVGVWTRSQRPREQAMTGPRFEQTDFSLQPQPYSAIELVHQQPVRWTHERIVSCDGGGGPAGHPRVFINTDKPQICVCGYCGLPYANEHHRQHLEALPQTSYQLE